MTTAAAIAAMPFACDASGSAPCLTPGFCQTCRAADARARNRKRHTKTNENRSRPTPRTTIEAIVWCVRERGPQALHEPENIERLARCDDATIAEIDARITKLAGKNAL